METKEKIRENRIRRKLKRMNFCLAKSRRRDPDAIDYGCYMITDMYSNAVVFGAQNGWRDLSLDDVEKWIRGKK